MVCRHGYSTKTICKVCFMTIVIPRRAVMRLRQETSRSINFIAGHGQELVIHKDSESRLVSGGEIF